MANALFVDALKGYEYFLKQRGETSLDEVNFYLESIGRNPIALRTYTHFAKLLEKGFRSYIPINKFDVFQAIGKIQLAADRRRYHREPSEIEVQISRNGHDWHPGKVKDISVVGFGIVTESKFPTNNGVPVWVRIEGYQDIPVVVIWRVHEENGTRLGVRAYEFIARYKLVEASLEAERLTGVLEIRRDIEGSLAWHNIFGVLEKTDELLKAVADLIYSFQDGYGVRIVLSRTVLDSIRFGSPGNVQIKIDFGIAEIIRLILEKIQFWGLQKREMKEKIRTLELDNEAKALATANLKTEIIRNAVKMGQDVQNAHLTKEITDGLNKILPGLLQAGGPLPEAFSPGSLELGILQERILPAAADLTAGDDTDFNVQISSPKDKKKRK